MCTCVDNVIFVSGILFIIFLELILLVKMRVTPYTSPRSEIKDYLSFKVDVIILLRLNKWDIFKHLHRKQYLVFKEHKISCFIQR